jgi:hypothetical protein
MLNDIYSDFAFLDGHDSLIVTANKKGKYGIINLNRKVIIPNIYDGPPREIVSGVLQFPLREKKFLPWRKKNKIYYGALNLTGEKVIPFKYLFLDRYGSEYISATTSTEQLYYNLEGEKIEVPKNKRFIKNEHFTEVFIGNDQKEVFAINQKKAVIFKRTMYIDGYTIGPDTNNLLQILDKRGKLVVADSSYQFFTAKYGLIKICKVNNSGNCLGYGLINFKGRDVLPPNYPNLYDWNKEFAVCSDTTVNLRVGMIDLANNKKVLDFKHRKITLMGCGYSMADEFPGIKYYDPSIKEITPIESKQIVSKETRIVIDQSHIEHINEKLKQISTTDFMFMEDCSLGNLRPIKIEGIGTINNEYGKEPSTEIFQVSIREQDYRSFLIDRNGTVVSKGTYAAISTRNKDLIMVYERDTINNGIKTVMGAIDVSGKQIISPNYDKIITVLPEALIVIKYGVYGVISRSDEIIVPIKYSMVKYDDAGYFLLSKFSKWQVADKNGKVLTKKYDEILEVYPEGIFKVKLADQVFFIDDYGNEHIER